MSRQAIQEYLLAIIAVYGKSAKAEKTNILNHAALATQLSRKQLIRRLKKALDTPLNTLLPGPGAPRKYQKELLLPHIRFISNAMERITAKRMHAALPEWLPFYNESGITGELKMELLKMSSSTLERYLSEIRGTLEAKKGLTSTSPARFMKNKIPINTLDKSVTKPGFTQADTVAHCGTTTAGVYINSITLTDIYSTWTENRALYSKKSAMVRRQFIDIEGSLPFALLAVNTDSGSEFLNNDIMRFMWGRENNIAFTRSRPYKKNDNCYVEQKHFTHVRALFGYERLDDQGLVSQMNNIYKNYWNPLHNFFLPSFKLKEKIRVGAKIVKKFEKPATPFQRLMNSIHITDKQKEALKLTKASLNPFELKKNLEKQLEIFFVQVNQLTIRSKAA